MRPIDWPDTPIGPISRWSAALRTLQGEKPGTADRGPPRSEPGFQAHLAKPMQSSELLATVASLAGKIGHTDHAR
jgi:hypothetical protein